MGRRKQIIGETQRVSFDMPKHIWEELQGLYPQIGAAGAMRKLAETHVSMIKAKAKLEVEL